MKFINIHTHKKLSSQNICIINIFPNDANVIEEDKLYSIGIHPWEVSNINIDEQILIIKDTISKENVLAVGEIGLDKYHENFDFQKEVFLKQIDLAKASDKPIVVHCVKAYSELLEILKKENLKIPIIIHRYSGNKTIAKELIKFGCYLSFGHELFNSKSKVQKVFKIIPLENVFLETDDSEIVIKDIYKKASEIKGVQISIIQESILTNYRKVFNK